MSVVTVQLGQCGNQVGFHLFDSLAQSAGSASDAVISSSTFKSSSSTSAAKKNYFSGKNRDDFVQEICERFFHERLPSLDTASSSSSCSSVLEARAVLVDMESKVVDNVTHQSEVTSRGRGKRGGGVTAPGTSGRGGAGPRGKDPDKRLPWRFNANRVFSRKMGSGNNWANGFLNYGAECREDIIDVVRKEVESCDAFQGFLLLMSLAGEKGEIMSVCR